MNTTACKYCGDQVRWAITPKAKRMPLNLDPDDYGNVVITSVDFRGNEHCRVLTKGEEPTTARYVAHAATCTARKGTR